MKTLLIDETLAIGKTVEAVNIVSDQCGLVFTDGTVLLLTTSTYDEDTEAEIEVTSKAPRHFYELTRLGIATEEEATAIRDADAAKHLAALEAQERATFEKLSKKFAAEAPKPVDAGATTSVKGATGSAQSLSSSAAVGATESA